MSLFAELRQRNVFRVAAATVGNGVMAGIAV